MSKQDRIKEDYKRISNQWQQEISDVDEIRSFFDLRGVYTRIPLANNHGAVRANQYVEFITSELFCPDGSWIGFEMKEDSASARKAASKLVKYLGTKLAETNFYGQITKLIKEGSYFNRGIIDTFYSNGLQFNTFNNADIACSMDSDESNKRAYITKWVSCMDIIARFKGEKVNMIKEELAGDFSQMKMRKLVTAIVPINELFCDKKELNTKYKFKKIYFICGAEGDIELVEPQEEESIGFTAFPLMTYMPHTEISLAQLALPMAVRLNEYEQLIGENARKTNRPAIAVPRSLLSHNNWNLGEGGVVPLAVNDRQPTPITSTQSFNLTGQEVQRLEAKIDQIFKAELITRINITNVSQYEAAGNYLNALKAIQPSAADLVTRVPLTLLARIDALLMDNDKEYRRLAKAANGRLTMVGLTGKMRKLQKASSIGKAAQAVTPYVQIDPSSAQRINSDMVVTAVFDNLDLPELIASDEEVAAEREAMAQQHQQQAAQEQQMAEADVAAKQAQAESALSK